jgi:hypothetical protein
MPFDSGRVSFSICTLPESLPADALQKFTEQRGQPLEMVNDQPQFGWVTGRHLLDTRIDEETAYAGGFLHLSLRTAQRKIPAALLKAECRMSELAMMSTRHSHHITRKEKKTIKAEVSERLIKDMPPTLTGIPFVVDEQTKLMYVGTATPPRLERFLQLFNDTIGMYPVPLTPEMVAEDEAGVSLDTLHPLIFSPEKSYSDEAGGVGRDFATWLWYFQEAEGGEFSVPSLGTFGIMIDGPLVFTSEGPGAHESTIRKGTPTTSAEAKAALVVGKKLNRARYIMARQDEYWVFTLEAPNFGFSGMALPLGEALDPMSQFEQRVLSLDIFRQAFVAIFTRYLNEIGTPEKAKSLTGRVQGWVAGMKSL